MSIPVFEQCGHKTQDVPPSKARRWLNTRPDDWTQVVESDLEQGIRYNRCLLHVEIPYQLLTDTLEATKAPTRRKIHPWLERSEANKAIDAGLVTETDPEKHQLVFTRKGLSVLQSGYAKLLHQDLDRGIELIGAISAILREAAREAAALWESGDRTKSWQDTLQATWKRTNDEVRMPISYDAFRQLPERMIKLLITVEPRTAERLLSKAL